MLTNMDSRLTSPDFFQSPWLVYTDLRKHAPVYWCEPWSQWVVTPHEEVNFMLKRPTLFSSSGWEARYLAQLPHGSREKLPNIYRHYETQVMSNSDAPEHTRLRKLVARSFSPKVIEGMRSQVESLVSQSLADLPEGTAIDWVTSLAYPLPATVIALLFGAPVEDTGKFERWSADIVAFIGSGSPQLELALRLEQSLSEFRDYLAILIEEHRSNPREDLLSIMIQKSEDGDSLTLDELTSTCITLLFAGHETTANLLSCLLLELFRNRDQWEILVTNPSLSPGAVEEALRFNGPVQRVRRVAREDLDLAGVKILKGDSVMGFIGAANRDDLVFPNASSFNIMREKGPHLAFGGGVHLCLGAALSRLEAGIVLAELVTQFPRTDLVGSFQEQFRQNMTFRGVESLEIELRR